MSLQKGVAHTGFFSSDHYYRATLGIVSQETKCLCTETLERYRSSRSRGETLLQRRLSSIETPRLDTMRVAFQVFLEMPRAVKAERSLHGLNTGAYGQIDFVIGRKVRWRLMVCDPNNAVVHRFADTDVLRDF